MEKFEVGKTYRIIDYSGDTTDIKITAIIDGWITFNVVSGKPKNNHRFQVDSWFYKNAVLIEDKPIKPNLCKLLDLEVDEPYQVEGDDGITYKINKDGYRERLTFCENSYQDEEEDLAFLINYPEKIIHIPLFSDDQLATMRECVKGGFPFGTRDEDGRIFIFKSKPLKTDSGWTDYVGNLKSLPVSFFPQIKWDNPEPFNFKAYLDGLK